MKKLLLFLIVLTPIVVLAQGSFDGTWKADAQSATASGKPDKYELKNGTYQCLTCNTKTKIKADGQFHPVTGSPYCESMSVKVVDDHTVETNCKKGDKVMNTATMKVSDDGSVMTTNFKFTSEANSETGSGRMKAKRSGAAPKGAHLISGDWVADKLEEGSDSIMTMTIKSTADGLSLSTPLGFTYDAKFDGKDYPAKGDPGITSVTLKKIDDNTVEELDKLNGKTVYRCHMAVQPDGKTMVYDFTDTTRGQSQKFKMTKQ